MRTDDVLAAVGLGLWQWDDAAGTATVDGRAARLLGLSGGGATHRAAAVRACLHPADWVTLTGAVSLAIAEGTTAESLLRVVDEDGTVRRTVRIRARPQGALLTGTLHEVRSRQSGAAAHTRDWRRSREAFLLDAGRALAEAASTTEVMRVAATLSMPGFSPEGLAVFGREGDTMTLVGHHGQTLPPGFPQELPLEVGYPAAEVIRTGRAVYLRTPQAYAERFPDYWPMVKIFGRSSWAFLPLTVGGTTIGAWLAAYREHVEFTPEERSVLTTVARMLAQALSRAGRHDSEQELSAGLQETMLPAQEPAIAGMGVATRYVPTGGGLQVGGDWYDVIGLPSGRTAIVIGDVQGHDVRAAGLMGQLRIALRAYAAEGHGPDAVLARASRFMAGLTEGGEPEDGRFATCLYVEVDQATGTLDVVRAGHPEPAVRLGDGTTMVRRTDGGLPLGVGPDGDYPTSRIRLAPGEVLLMCTDGLLETGGHDVESGWQRLRAVFEAGPTDDLEDLADSLIRAVHGPASHRTTGPLADHREDDIALVLLRRDQDGPTCAAPLRRTQLTVPQADPGRIRAARDDIRSVLHDWSSAEQVETAVLLACETLTNVLVHTDEDAFLTATVLGVPGFRTLRVEVGDRSDDMPHRLSPGELASTGRGLLLIEALADAWGVEPQGEGKSIWFELHEAAAGPPVAAPGGR